MSQGSSKEEALANLEAVLDGCLAVRAECGMPPTVEAEICARPDQELHPLEVDVPKPGSG